MKKGFAVFTMIVLFLVCSSAIADSHDDAAADMEATLSSFLVGSNMSAFCMYSDAIDGFLLYQVMPGLGDVKARCVTEAGFAEKWQSAVSLTQSMAEFMPKISGGKNTWTLLVTVDGSSKVESIADLLTNGYTTLLRIEETSITYNVAEQ